jgi:hypothetical protein
LAPTETIPTKTGWIYTPSTWRCSPWSAPSSRKRRLDLPEAAS